MNRMPAMLILSLLIGGCGAPAVDEPDGGDGQAEWVPPTACPLDAAEVAQAVGREMAEESVTPGQFGISCRFSDGVATVDVALGDPVTGEMLFEADRTETAQQYGEEDEVKDLDRGNLGYLATNNSSGEIIEGRAVVVTDELDIDVVLLGIDLDQAEYEQALVGLIDAILE